MTRKDSKKKGNCAYCGRFGVIEREDVIPKCLFPKPRPSDLVKVPSCRTCNFEKSKDDDYLRDIIVCDIDLTGHPAAEKLFEEKVTRSARRNSSDFARYAAKQAKLGPYVTTAGIYLGEAYSTPIDGVRVGVIFKRLVRGLYFRIRGTQLPDSYVYEVRRIDMLGFKRVWPEMNHATLNGPHTIGGDLFACVWGMADSDPYVTIWWLFFYGRFGVFVSSLPPVQATE